MSISNMDLKERSLLFAQLAQIAYKDPKEAKKEAKVLGFTKVEFYDRDGAQAYRFQNKTDLIVACRGTEPTEFQDIVADLRAAPVKSESEGRVHVGFKTEVDDLWPMVLEDITRKQNQNKKLWFCGHSLGAAMATIMASRCWHEASVPNPEELYTYGSPRAGWPSFVKTLAVSHQRWVNNNDIVTTVPPWWLGYKHDGTERYLNTYGNVRSPGPWQKFKDKMRGTWMGLKAGKIDAFTDHSIDEYVKHLEKYNNE